MCQNFYYWSSFSLRQPLFSKVSLPPPKKIENIKNKRETAMTIVSASSPSSVAAATTSPPDRSGVTPLQLGFAAIILGASAGLTLYTKKTSHMLNQLERASKNAVERKGPPKLGPQTKFEWEKTRNRWEKDDL
jgi:hypothetical protein